MNYQPTLFPKSKSEKLLEWIKWKGEVRTSEIIRWGLENFYNHAERQARLFGEQGIIRRLTEDEVLKKYGAVYREKIWKYTRPDLGD